MAYIISSGESSEGIILNFGDSMTVFDGGTAGDTTVNLGGTVEVSSGGTVNGTTVNSRGCLNISQGGIVTYTTVNTGGIINVSSGGTATDILENGGGVYVDDDSDVTFSPNTIDGLVLSEWPPATIHSGTIATNTTINSNGMLHICNGGIAKNTTLVEGGNLRISSGGTATDTTINSTCCLLVFSGGIANTIAVNRGGVLRISSGASATDILWTPCEGSIHVSEGGYATFVSQYSGVYYGANEHLLSRAESMDAKMIDSYDEMYVMFGGMATNITVNNSGYIYVSSGGIANGTFLNGYFFISNGGTVNDTTANGWGEVSISSGGIANNTTLVEGGDLYVSSGGIANGTTVNSLCYLYVSSGGTANSIKENGGYVSVADGAEVSFVQNTISELVLSSNMSTTVHSGTTATNTIINSGGELHICSGGTADNTTVNNWSYLYVFDGGTADNATVNAGGVLHVSGGGMLTGRMSFEDGAIVSTYEGAILEFDLTQTAPGAEALVHGLSLVQGTPAYTLSVGGEQGECTYVLADDAEGFDSTISVVDKTTEEELGTLSGAWKVRNGDWDYQLKLTGSVLSVSVTAADVVAPTVTEIKADITTITNQDVTVTAVFSDDVELAQSLYRLEQTGEWLDYDNGLTVDRNTTVFFRAVDTAGNESEIVSFEVTNIDKTPPENPVPKADVTEQTVGEVTVSASFSEDSVAKEYSFDGETWTPYEEALRFTDNGTVFFRGTDEAGNETKIAEYDVTNIEPALISGAVIQPGENAVVITGQTYLDTVVSEDGTLLVSTGGTAENVTVEDCGSLTVFIGGTATCLNVSEDAELNLYVAQDTYASGTFGESSFEVKDAFVSGWTLDALCLDVCDGGAVDGLIVNPGGRLFVYGNGTATNILENGGYLSVKGDDASVTLIPNTLSGMTLRGRTTIHSGTSAIDLTLSGGILTIFSGTAAEGTTMSGGSILLSGGTAANTAIGSGYLYILSGGTAANTAISSGRLIVSSGGMALDTTVSSGGILRVSSGGTADGILFESDSYLEIESGGTAGNFTIFNGVSIKGKDGRTFSGIALESAGNLNLKAGDTVSNLTISSGAVFKLSSGVSADGITVLSGGTLYVSRNAGATNVNWTLTDSKAVVLESNAYVTYAGPCSGIYHGLSSKPEAMMLNKANLNGDYYVMPGGTIDGSIVNGGRVTLYGGMMNAIVLKGGSMCIYGGTANAVVASGGSINVAGSGILRNLFFTSSYGAYGNPTYITVSTDGIVSAAKLGNTMDSQSLNTNMRVFSGGTASDVSVIGQARLLIESGGTAANVDLFQNYYSNYGGGMGGVSVGSGGTLIGATANPGNGISVNSGGTALEIRENGGYVSYDPKWKDAVVTFVPNSFSGYVYDATVHSGTTANRIILNRTRIDIFSGGTASDTIASAGYIYISSGGYAVSTTLKGWFRGNANIANPSMFIYSGGTAEYTYLAGIDYPPGYNLSCGIMTLSGGTANHTTIVSGGLLTVSGGVVDDVSINGHKCPWVQNNYDPKSDDRFYGTMLVQGGTVTNVTVNNGGFLSVSWRYPGSVTGIVENGGYVSASPSNKKVTFASNTFSRIVLGNYESATAHSGTTATSITLESGGRLDLYSDGKLTGRTFMRGGIVSAYEGAIVEFDLTQMDPYAATRINDLSAIRGTPTYTIVVNADQAKGIYALAEKVSSIKDITLTCADWDESYQLNTKNSVTIAGVEYKLFISDKTLMLRIGDSLPQQQTSGPAVSDETVVIGQDETISGASVLQGGSLCIGSGGLVDGATVENGGRLEVQDGGKITGWVTNNGGKISVLGSATVDFDLTQTVFNEAPLFNNLSGFSLSNNVFTITTDGNQVNGFYLLAGRASNFKKTVTVMNKAGEELGTLTVGKTSKIAEVDYLLFLSDDKLVLQVGEMYTTDGYILTSNSITDKAPGPVSSGEVCHDTVIFSNGVLNVLNSGTADAPTVYSGGSLIISSGGSATNIIENGGCVIIKDGAEATFASNVFRNSMLNGSVTLHSGTTAFNTRIAGDLFIYDGGVANGVACAHPTRDLPFDSYTVKVYSGGILNDAEVVNSRCKVNVYSGGTANRVVLVYSGLRGDEGYAPCGTMTVDQGTANSTTVARGGSMVIISGGTANDTLLCGGSLFMERGSGTVTNTAILDGGYMSVGLGGVVDGVRVDSGGVFYFGGKDALNIVENGGYVSLGSASLKGSISFLSNTFSGVELTFLMQKSATLHSGTTAVSTTINSRCVLEVYEGGVASGVLVHSFGSAEIYGGTANNVVINDRGIMHVDYVKGYDSDGRTSKILPTLNDVVVTSGGSLRITSAAEVNGLTVLQGAMFSISETKDTTFSRTILTDASITLGRDASATDTVLNGRSVLSVGYRATATSTTVNSGCRLITDKATVTSVTVASGGILNLHGGTVTGIEMESGARFGFIVSSDTYVQGTSAGIAFETKDASISDFVIEKGNSITVNRGTATSMTVKSGGHLSINYGTTATDIEAEAGASFGFHVASGTYVQATSAGIAIEMKDASLSDYAISNGNSVIVESGGVANGITVNRGGELAVWEDGAANGITINEGGTGSVEYGGAADGITLNDDSYLCVNDYGTANNIVVNANSMVEIFDGGTVNGITVRTDGNLTVAPAGRLTGRITFEEGAVISVEEGLSLDFDLRQTETGAATLVNDLSVISSSVMYYSLTVNGDMMPGSHTIALADGAAEFNSTISVMNQAGVWIGTLALDETVTIGYNDYTLSLADGTLSVTVEAPDLTPQEPVGSTEKVSWETTGAEQYIVEYSTDNFEHVIQVVTTGNATETPGLPAGTDQWRVKSDTNSYWAVGEEIVSEPDPDETPKVVQSVEDGNDDLFFATASGTWENIYYAQNVGSVNDWTGTNEIISANGKGKIQNLFFGSTDPNVLCLTDGENGDAIFVDDVYTELPESVAEHTARLYKIQEVRAGAGDDIVDMTSQRFEYVGDGLTIRGGDGNDTIWATKGNNFLFGDAGNDRIVGASGNDVIAGGIGNDRMHGGGGDDIFTFCNNWGEDTVEQLAGGSVTLWFASGDESKWNAETLTYMDGDNSVTVKGVASVALKFGNDGSEQYVALASAGAFAEFTSQKIFEEAGKGLLA